MLNLSNVNILLVDLYISVSQSCNHLDEFQTHGNITLRNMLKMSIPRKNLGPGRERIIAYENCFQYDINFEEVYPKDQPWSWPIEASESWPTVYCKNGWEYDKSEYENSLVTEGSLQIH